MAVIRNDIDLPVNCVECDEMGIRGGCRLIFSGCANCGRHPSCPLRSADEMIVEIGGLQCFGDGSYPMSKNVYVDGKKVLGIIHKYIDREN